MDLTQRPGSLRIRSSASMARDDQLESLFLRPPCHLVFSKRAKKTICSSSTFGPRIWTEFRCYAALQTAHEMCQLLSLFINNPETEWRFIMTIALAQLPRGRFPTNLSRDLTAGLVVFLVAVPLCLGIALASNAPILSGVLAGIIGGLIVGALSGSQTSISGPAAALAAIAATQIADLGSFAAFQLAVVVAGLIQIGLGLARAGSVAKYIPSSVIKGLLAAIGILLILKQIPHLLGHDVDPEGEMSFLQPDQANTFTELQRMLGHTHFGATVIGLGSIAVMLIWARIKLLKTSIIPAPLAAVVFGAGMGYTFQCLGGIWSVEPAHFVQMPVADGFAGFVSFFQTPDWSQIANPAIYRSGLVLAAAASLASLLNLESVDKLDPEQRTSPPSRELWAQGVGNVLCGLVGGLPVTSEVIRGSINVNAGGQSKWATMIHGWLLLVSVIFFPLLLNRIPLSCLAAILLVTGARLASWKLFQQMWNEGRYQFLPFVLTVGAIVLTDLLIGVVIGLFVSLGFILNSTLRRPIRRIVEKHLGGDVLHIELANQVSFLNREALSQALGEVPVNGQVLLDAQHTDYIDPDVLDLIREFKEQTAPARGIRVSQVGFRPKYQLRDQVQYLDHATCEIQSQMTPQAVLQLLKEGHQRFLSGQRLTRDLGRQVRATAQKQHPLAVVLSCIDSRTPTELIFDLGLGDILSVRVAGNIVTHEILGSMEYACAVAKAKLIVIMGHTRCGAVTAAVDLTCSTKSTAEATGCDHLDPIVDSIQQSVDPACCARLDAMSTDEKEAFVNDVARENVRHATEEVLCRSPILNQLHESGEIAIIGAVYDVISGEIQFVTHEDACVT